MRVFLILLSVLVISCGGERKPKNLIAKKDFVDLLVDIHLFDAMATDHTLNKITGDLDSLTLYSSILAKHEVTKDAFESTMHWYTSKPEEFSDIYEDAFAKINKLSQQWNDDQELFSSSKNETIFKTKKYIDARGDSVFYPEPFWVNVDSVGTYLIDIRIRMLVDDKSKNPHINAMFYNDTIAPSDSLLAVNAAIIKSNFSRDYQYIVPLEDKKMKFLKITVPEVDPDTVMYRKNLQLSSLKVSVVNEEEK